MVGLPREHGLACWLCNLTRPIFLVQSFRVNLNLAAEELPDLIAVTDDIHALLVCVVVVMVY